MSAHREDEPAVRHKIEMSLCKQDIPSNVIEFNSIETSNTSIDKTFLPVVMPMFMQLLTVGWTKSFSHSDDGI